MLALALTPEFIIDEKTKQMILKPIEVDGKPLDARTVEALIKESVDKEFDELEKYVEMGDYEGFVDTLKRMNEKFYIRDESVIPLFDVWFYGYQKLKKMKDKDIVGYTRGSVLLSDYIKSLKKQYETIKMTNVKLEAIKEMERAKQLKEQERKTGVFSCEG